MSINFITDFMFVIFLANIGWLCIRESFVYINFYLNFNFLFVFELIILF